MEFGDALKKILELHDIKMYNLASYLGYDASYISKWVTGSKLPPIKNVKKITRAIAEFCADQGTPVQKKEFLAFLQIDIDDTNSDAYVSVITEYLLELLTDSEITAKADLKSSLDTPRSQPNYITIFNQLFYQINSTELDLTMSLTFFCDLYKTLLNLSTDRFESATIRVMADPTQIRSASKEFCRKICNFFSCCQDIKFLFYQTSSSIPQNQTGDFLIAMNEFVILPVCVPFTQAGQYTFIEDHNFVSASYSNAMIYLDSQPLLWTFAPGMSSIAKREVYRFDMGIPHRYILHTLTPCANAESLVSFLNESFPNASDYNFVIKNYRDDALHIRDMFVYESTLLDFVHTGHIQVGPSIVVSLSEEQRRSYLEDFIAETELEDNPLNLRVVTDQNPVLPYTSFRLNLSLSDDTGFLLYCDDYSSDTIYLRTPEAIEVFNSMFRRIQELPEQYLLPPSQSKKYIQRLMQFI